MNLLEKFSTISLQHVIEMFTPIFVFYHNWNVDDTSAKVKRTKREFIRDKLLDASNKNIISGNLVYRDAYDKNGNQMYDGYGYVETTVDYYKTTFNLEEVFNFLIEIVISNKSTLPYIIVKKDGLTSSTTTKIQKIKDNKTNEIETDIVKNYIGAAIAATIYCIEEHNDISITKVDLNNELRHKGFVNVEVEEIFKMIPETLRHPDKGGPPKKLIDKAIEAAFYAGTLFSKEPTLTLAGLSEEIESRFGKTREDIMNRIYKFMQEYQQAKE
jgi:hypothetical protein